MQCNQMSDVEISSLKENLKTNLQKFKNARLDIEKGVAELTELGKCFVKICL